MMKLSDYLAKNDLTNRAFAELASVSEATISRISREIQKPDWPTMMAIQSATKGKVTPSDFYSEEAA